MKKARTLATLNLIFYIVAFLVSNLSQLQIIVDKNIGDVSDKYDTIFAPAGITFTIWGIIYLGLFGFTIYHLLKAYRADLDKEPNQVVLKINYLFIINNIATSLWVFVWLYEYVGIALILMLIQLFTLIGIIIKADIFDPRKSTVSKIFTQIPLSLYFAWICIATIANVSAYLVSIDWGGGGISPTLWTIILIAVASFLSVYIIRFRQNPYFGLVVMWAFYGIQLKRVAINPVLFENVISAAWFGIGFVTLLVLMQFVFNAIKPKKHHTKQINA